MVKFRDATIFDTAGYLERDDVNDWGPTYYPLAARTSPQRIQRLACSFK